MRSQAALTEVKTIREDPLAAVVAMFDELDEELKALDQDYREARARIDEKIQKVSVTVRQLFPYRATLTVVDDAGNSKRVRIRRGTDPHVQAGPAALSAVRSIFSKKRTLTQAAVAAAAGLSSGTTTHAIRALASDGVIVRTGKKINRSPEWEFVSRADRVTRFAPGS